MTMDDRQPPLVVRYLRKLAGTGPAANQVDRDLLERFATGREETAFEALVQRHGPMVLGVCRRVLRDAHDAEDAFQATFLVLIRKAASLDQRGSVAGWLYTVAYRLALKAKANAWHHRMREGQLDALPAPEAPADSIWWELRPILDEELHRLPEKFRVPVVLCYLEGKTTAEAAHQLGCPPGTVSSRLARARDRLRARLARRGLALSSGLFVTALTRQGASAAPPSTLVQAAFQGALSFMGGKGGGAAPTPADVLAEGMLRPRWSGWLKIAAALLLTLGVAGAGTAFLLPPPPADQPSAADPRGASGERRRSGPEEPDDPECRDYPRRGLGPTLVARPEAFPTLVGPDCTHCRDVAERRGAALGAKDRVLCWVRGDFNGGVIPLRFFLNPHRVISDKYGVFVYDPDAGYARGFAPSLDFRFYGWRGGVLVIQHKDGTLYSGLSGRALAGPRKGSRLRPVPTLMSDWGFWLQRYPETLAYRLSDKDQPVALPTAVHPDSCHSRGPADRRLVVTTPVLGVVEGRHARAYPLATLARAGLLRDRVRGRPRLLLWYGPTRTAAAYRPVASAPGNRAQPTRKVTIELDRRQAAAPFRDRETGSRWDITGRAVAGELTGWTLAWLDGVQVKWFAWAAEYPQTSIFGK
jgi:RNA polymerase sigma factor (sigma-70 family)